MTDFEVHETTAIIDNGRFGTRTVRFETGRLARQAAGSAVAYLDDETMLLSATTASKHPKEQFDFFPLTVDVEERMYAAGRIPGSYFRREGRPGTEAILTCRLIDRPLRPSFVDGLRNEIQIVVTVLSLNPQDLYDAVAINAASMSTQLAGLPFSGPIGGVRIALISQEAGSQWVAFPTREQLDQGRLRHRRRRSRRRGDDVAIMMVEAEATENMTDLIARGRPGAHRRGRGRRAWKPRSRSSRRCARPSSRAGRAGRQGDRRVPDLPGLRGRRAGGRHRRRVRRAGPGADHRRQAGAREPRIDEVKALCVERVSRRRCLRGPREGDRRRVPRADQEAGPPAHPARQGPHRRPWHHRHPVAVGRGRRGPAGARFGAVRARRDPDHGRHHAEHAAHGAEDRLALPGDHQALPAPLQLPALLHR